MKVCFLGVGSAVDESYPNTSILVLSKTKLLLDCGYSAAQKLWCYNPNPSFLDAIFISHLHADHFFGLPSLLLRMLEDKRIKPLIIVCSQTAKTAIMKVNELGYSTILKRIAFPLNFIEVKSGQSVKLNELTLSFAKTSHTVSNFAIKIEEKGKSICYSGDGDYTKDSERLFEQAGLLIHEGFLFDEKINGHGSITDTIAMAHRAKVKLLKIIHVNRKERKKLPMSIWPLLAREGESVGY